MNLQLKWVNFPNIFPNGLDRSPGILISSVLLVVDLIGEVVGGVRGRRVQAGLCQSKSSRQ